MAQNQQTGTQAQGGSHDVGFPPFKSETYGAQLLWLALTFGLLYVLMKRLILPRLSGIITMRADVIARDLDEAAVMKARAEEAGHAYEKALSESRASAQKLAQETRDQLAQASEHKRKTLEAELSSRLQLSEATITTRKNEAMSHVDAIASELVGDIVHLLTGKAPSAQDVRSALNARK
jgi:F-type H+-transporting ATPase subunit b